MDLLTIKVPTTALDEACLSQGGLVDRDTAAADCVVLGRISHRWGRLGPAHVRPATPGVAPGARGCLTAGSDQAATQPAANSGHVRSVGRPAAVGARASPSS